METERKAVRTAKFNKNKNAKRKQINKRYKKEKKENQDDAEDTRISRNPDRFESGEQS